MTLIYIHIYFLIYLFFLFNIYIYWCCPDAGMDDLRSEVSVLLDGINQHDAQARAGNLVPYSLS